MNGSFLKNSLVFTALFSLSLSAVPGQTKQPSGAPQAAPTAPVPDHHKQGYEFGKKLLHILNQPDSPELMNQAVMDKEILRLSNIINKEAPSTDAHKKAFKEYQAYYKGLKEGLAGYVPSKETDMISLGKNYAIKVNQDMADIITKAPDMATARTEIGKLVAKAANDAQKFMPQRPKVTFTVDVNHPHYKEGHATGKLTTEWFVVEAQGKTIPEDDQMALQKRMSTYMMNSQTQGSSQEEIIKGSLQYLSGYKKALEEFNLEQTLSTYKTPKETAERLRIGYKFAHQSMESTLDSLQNPEKGFGGMSKAFQDCASDMNKAEKKS